MGEDPFDEIDDDYGDREGDPFEQLDGPDDGVGAPDDGADERQAAETDSTREDAGQPSDPAASATPDSNSAGPAGPDGDPGPNVDVGGDPFGDVDVSRGDPFESADSPFEQVDVDSVDPDAVWARFTEEAEAAERVEAAEGADASLGGEDVPEDASDVVTVPKGRFCQTCPHFSAPPEATCGHEGTEILTFVGTGEVRVSNCPVVRERRELGETFE